MNEFSVHQLIQLFSTHVGHGPMVDLRVSSSGTAKWLRLKIFVLVIVKASYTKWISLLCREQCVATSSAISKGCSPALPLLIVVSLPALAQ